MALGHAPALFAFLEVFAVPAKISDADLRKMPDDKRLRIYAGGERRTVTAGYLRRLRKRRHDKEKSRPKRKGR